MDEHDGGESRTELNSHANMVVVGKHANISAGNVNKVDVRPFTPGLFQIQMRISFLFLLAKDLCGFLLIMRTHIFLLSCT